MSLNYFKNIQKGKDLDLNIGCNALECTTVTCQTVQMPNGADLNAHDVTVNGILQCNDDALIGGVNYNTPDIGQPNYSLHTDGAGNAFWSPDDTGSGDITYNGVPPTTVGQHLKFTSTDGKTVDQSKITESATEVDIADLILKGQQGELTDGVSYRNTLGGPFTYKWRNVDGPTGVGEVSFRSRGTYTLPTALLGGDLISRYSSSAHNGTDYKSTCGIYSETTEVQTPLTMGSRVIIKSTDTGTAGEVDKLIISDNISVNNADLDIGGNNIIGTTSLNVDEVTEQTLNNGVNIESILMKDGTATFGSGSNTYKLPPSSFGALDNSVLVFDAISKNLDFKMPVCYTFQYGGNINTLADYAVPQGDPNLVTNSTLNATKEVIIPYSSSIKYISYSTTSGDATSTLGLWKSGVNITSAMLTGAQGVYSLPVPITMFAGDRFAISMNSGTVVGPSNIMIFSSF